MDICKITDNIPRRNCFLSTYPLLRTKNVHRQESNLARSYKYSDPEGVQGREGNQVNIDH